MPTWIGYFNKAGAPAIKIGISGVLQRKPTEFEATVDTGFSGFLSMPLLQAFPIGLVLKGTMALQYADGSASDKLIALGEVSVGNELEINVIILHEKSNTVLVGMEFLQVFRKRLIVSTESKTVLLEDEPQHQAVAAIPVAPTP